MFKKIAAALRSALNRGWSFTFKFPLPVLFAAAILSASIVAIAASSPVNYYGTLIVPTGGTITDTNATPSACVGTTAAKVYTYGSACVTSVTASGNIASSGGTNPNLTFTGLLPIANGGTGTTTGVCSICAVTNANNNFSTGQTISGSLSAANLYDTGVAANSLACLGAGSLFAACTVSSPLSFSGTTLSLTTVPISLGGTNSTSFTSGDAVYYNGTSIVTYAPPWSIALGGTNATSATTGCIGYNGTAHAHSNCVDTAGTGLGLSGTTLSLTVPVTTANGGTNQTSWTSGDCVRSSSATQLASAAGDCVTSVTAGNGITSSGGTTPAISVNNCGASICVTGLNIVVAGENGSLTVGTFEPPVAVGVGIVGGSITELMVSCGTADNGTSIATFYKNGTSIGTVTLSSSKVTTSTISAVSLAHDDQLTAGITTAGGPAQNCAFEANGTQEIH